MNISIHNVWPINMALCLNNHSDGHLSVYNDSWWPKKVYLYTTAMVPRVQFTSINCCTCIISSQL